LDRTGKAARGKAAAVTDSPYVQVIAVFRAGWTTMTVWSNWKYRTVLNGIVI
jgi:hypothetical protein